MEALARASVLDRFGAPDGGLLDVVDGPDGADPALRPNQLLALLPAPRAGPRTAPCRRGGPPC